jgi:hypothetical protein
MTTASPVPATLSEHHVSQEVLRGTLVVLEVIVALGAFAGGIALAGNSVDASSYLGELPFSSTAFAGVALAVLVGVPAAFAAVATVLGHESRLAHLSAGGLLMGWIVAEVIYIGMISWLQPAMFVVGGVIALLGWLRPRRPSA